MKKGKKISQEKEDKIIEFNSYDENSRQMPGKKDHVSVAKRSHTWTPTGKGKGGQSPSPPEKQNNKF